jgi:23S rRNA pseudouridine1911/1915/1917 synthase
MSEDLEFESEQEEELFEHHRFKADPGQEMIRIDKFLIDRLANTSRNKIQIAAKNGNIYVNNQKVKQNYRVKPGDEIAIVLPYPIRELKLIPQNIPIEIVYEDNECLVVNKSANMVVHPGYGNYSGTLVNALVYHFDNLPTPQKDYYGRPGLVHRIDKHTTGLLVIAKTELALTNLAAQFFERTTERLYYALVWGDIEKDGTITGNIGRSQKNRKVMAVYPNTDQGKHAVTHYKVLERFGNVTLVECKLETGRTHQIRVHFQSIGHPLFNDLEYGGNKVLKGPTSSGYTKFVQNCFELIPGQALHAKSLGFKHPVTKNSIYFDCDLPKEFESVLIQWRKYNSY